MGSVKIMRDVLEFQDTFLRLNGPVHYLLAPWKPTMSPPCYWRYLRLGEADTAKQTAQRPNSGIPHTDSLQNLCSYRVSPLGLRVRVYQRNLAGNIFDGTTWCQGQLPARIIAGP